MLRSGVTIRAHGGRFNCDVDLKQYMPLEYWFIRR